MPNPLQTRLILPVWASIRTFAGFDRQSPPLLWTRWLYLRAIGAVYVVIFGGVLYEQSALAGSQGLMPVTDYLARISQSSPGAWQAFWEAPTLFWLNSSDAAMTAVAVLGLVASCALLFNLWPRLALFLCWVTFLSFVSTWQAFSGAQLDALMLEVALLSIPFAPRGWRPGLGTAPWPLAVFMMRWLLFRVMFESGVVKVLVGDPSWRNFTAMEHMYETAPFPTLFGFFDHNMPQAYHVFEILLTYFAELLAPVLAFVAGRKGRWLAFFSWTLFQAGIQLTNNFGWLNTASIGLGLLLLDDQMLRQLIRGLRLTRFIPLPEAATPPPSAAKWRAWLRPIAATLLGLHFFFACFYLAKTLQVKVYDLHPRLNALVETVAKFQSVNEYYLYARVKTTRLQVEFVGSNDGGRTWRPYRYKHLIQSETDINGFIAPRFVRFDATMQIVGIVNVPSRALSAVGHQLLLGNPRTLSLFEANPFPEGPPELLRVRRYRLNFTDVAAWRRTGRYWVREPAGDLMPPLHKDSTGRIRPFDLSEPEAALRRGNPGAAFALLSRQYAQGYFTAGFRLFDFLMRGIGTRPDPQQAFALMEAMAREGEPEAVNHLGACYEYGLGVPPDLNQAVNWYRQAAESGLPLAYFNLGSLYTRHPGLSPDDTEALALLLVSVNRLTGDNPVSDYILDNQPNLVRLLRSRMSAAQIAAAAARAANWP